MKPEMSSSRLRDDLGSEYWSVGRGSQRRFHRVLLLEEKQLLAF